MIKPAYLLLVLLTVSKLSLAQFPFTYGSENDDEIASDIIETSLGQYLFCFDIGTGYKQIGVGVLNSNGELVNLMVEPPTAGIGRQVYSVHENSDGSFLLLTDSLICPFIVCQRSTQITLLNADLEIIERTTPGLTINSLIRSQLRTPNDELLIINQPGAYPIELVKINSEHEIDWVHTYQLPPLTGSLLMSTIIQSQTSGYYVAGRRSSNNQMLLMKLDENGDTIWTKNHGQGYSYFNANSLLQENNGDLLIVGDTSLLDDSRDIFMMRTDEDGEIISVNRYGGTGNESARSITKLTDGSYLIYGTTTSFGEGGSDLYLLNVNAAGEVNWSHTYGSELEEFATKVLPTSDGGFLLLGDQKTPDEIIDHLNSDVYIVKVNSDGEVVFIQENIGSQLDQDVVLYPNPARDFVSFTFNDPIQPSHISFFNEFGQKIFESIATTSTFQLDISQFATGIYHYQITDQNDQVHHGKLLIE